MRLYSFIKDFFVKKEIFYVKEQAIFNNVLKDIIAKKLLAFDTEFTWRNTYFPKLSLMQISTENKIYIIDCLEVDIINIEKILKNKSIIKIFHSIRGDSSVIFNCLGIKSNNIFDTQLAENILYKNKEKQISYKKLVKKYCFRDIPKSETNSDWEKRPLRDNQIDYAAEDVRYLHTIMRMQFKKLSRLNKLNLFWSECNREKNLGEVDFLDSRLKRYKKKKNISEIDIKIFKWRENQARILNVPPSHIVENKNLKNLKKIMIKKNYDEHRWIIKEESSRNDFIENFL